MKNLLRFEGNFYKPEIFRVLWSQLVEKYKTDMFEHNGKKYKRIIGNPIFPTKSNTITAIGIRNNAEICFNEDLFNNDDLIVYENTTSGEVRLWRFKCTLDPKSRKIFNIAHQIKGVWVSYLVGNHRHQPGRTALRQDANDVIVARTDSNGNVVKVEQGKFGINVHNKNGFYNSSLGCTIVDTDINYKTKLKPLLDRIKGQKPITYITTDHWDVDVILQRISITSVKSRPIEFKSSLPTKKSFT